MQDKITRQATELHAPNTLIWSGEYRAYWLPEAAGYTADVNAAGVWHYSDAERETRHCGPEKQIRLVLRHEVAAVILFAQRRDDAAKALWHRFAPGSKLE